MRHKYYLDESGNSGDLISRKGSLNFGNQPIFALACIGIKDFDKLNLFVDSLKIKHGIKDAELKSDEIYFRKPEVILDLAIYICKENLPVFVELVDKKYCIASSIVQHHVIPSYLPNELDEFAQVLRNELADYIAENLTSDCYKSFFKACIDPVEENLIASMEKLKMFFNAKNSNFFAAELVAELIEESIDDFNKLKPQIGMHEAVKKFIPIPDTTKNGMTVNLLPHVHSIFNIIARLNKYHSRLLKDVELFHDKQNDFDDILLYCKECLKNSNLSRSNPPGLHVDFLVTEDLSLNFVDSKSDVGIQIADLLAGFFNRYINGLLYKNIEIRDVYHNTFKEFKISLRPKSPLGVNFVIPKSRALALTGRVTV